jgi:hypothetical protein
MSVYTPAAEYNADHTRIDGNIHQHSPQSRRRKWTRSQYQSSAPVRLPNRAMGALSECLSSATRVFPLSLELRKTDLPRKARLYGGVAMFCTCLFGLWWTDYLLEKYPPTEEQKRRLDEIKKVRFPSKADFLEAREQAMRARAQEEGVDSKNN